MWNFVTLMEEQGLELLFFALTEEQRLELLEKRVMRISGPKRDTVMH
jgi:hypothetical protein